VKSASTTCNENWKGTFSYGLTPSNIGTAVENVSKSSIYKGYTHKKNICRYIKNNFSIYKSIILRINNSEYKIDSLVPEPVDQEIKKTKVISSKKPASKKVVPKTKKTGKAKSKGMQVKKEKVKRKK